MFSFTNTIPYEHIMCLNYSNILTWLMLVRWSKRCLQTFCRWQNIQNIFQNFLSFKRKMYHCIVCSEDEDHGRYLKVQ